jgi:putative transcriptional regulator
MLAPVKNAFLLPTIYLNVIDRALLPTRRDSALVRQVSRHISNDFNAGGGVKPPLPSLPACRSKASLSGCRCSDGPQGG